MTTIYGVDTTKPYSCIDVRDAIIKCFNKAHKQVLKDALKTSSDEEVLKLGEGKTEALVQDYFEQINGDYNNPTKKDLIKVCEKLKEFARYFRDKEVIEKHHREIVALIEGL